MEVLPLGHPLIVRFRTQHCIAHGVTVDHGCTRDCRYIESAERAAFVCVESLHVHRCQPSCPFTESVRGVRTCPISGFERSGQTEVYYKERVTAFGGGERFVSTIQWTNGRGNGPRKAAKSRPVCRGGQVKAYVRQLLLATSPFDDQIAGAGRRCKDLLRPFQDNIGPLVAALNQNLEFTAEPPDALCEAIAAYVAKIQPRVTPAPSVDTMIAVVYSLLATGLTMGGVEVFPRTPWVARRAPPLVDYAKKAGLQCRSMSVCTRRLKSVMRSTAVPGTILPEFIFADATTT